MPSRFTSKKGPSQRQLRAGELIRHALVEILQREDLREPALKGVSITVSEVRTSPDLKNASVFATALGASMQGDGDAAVIDALNRAAPHIRHLLAGKLEMKHTPALKFVSDASFDEARRIDELLADPKVAKDLRRN